MNYSKNKTLITYAIQLGCKTAADFAQLLKARKAVEEAYYGLEMD